MAEYELKNIFKINLMALSFVGLWPTKGEYGGNKIYTIYAIVVILGCPVFQLLTQSMVLFHLDGDPYLLASATHTLLQPLVYFLKTYYFLSNISQIKSLMATSSEDMFQPKNDEQKKLMDTCIHSWKFGYFSFMSNIFAVMFLWFLIPVLDHTTAEYRLPLFAWYPFEYKFSPVYEIVYAHQAISVSYFLISMINIDLFGAALMTYVAAQCDLLSNNLKNLGSELKSTKGPSYDFKYYRSSKEEAERKVIIKQMHIELVQCINHHRSILRITKEVKSFFSINSLGQLGSSTLAITMALFRLFLIDVGTTEFFLMILYILSAFQQLLMYCWYGSEVIAKSSKIAYSVFESNWIEGSKQFRKDVLFFSRCSQEVIKFYAVDFFELSLDTFMRVANGSYSCFALLCQVYDTEG